MAGLTSEQRAHYDEQGYVVLPGVFNKREVAQMAAEADRLAQWQVAISLALGAPTPRLDVQRRDDKVVLRKIQPVNDVSPVFTMYSNDERLLRPLRELLGCEPMLMEEKLNYKQVLPGNPEVVTGTDEDDSFPFHTDLAYYCLDGYPPETVSSAISIDETTAANGPIQVVPCSHKRDWPLREGWPPIVADDALRGVETVPLLAPAGSLFLFNSALVHASSANRTCRPRRVMIFSHYPETHPIEYDKRNRPLRAAGQAAEDRYEELVYSGVKVPEYRLR